MYRIFSIWAWASSSYIPMYTKIGIGPHLHFQIKFEHENVKHHESFLLTT